MFNKRHYEAIALAMQDAIRSTNSSTEVGGVYKAVGQLANTFAHDNQLFQRERFVRACAPGANVRAKV